MALLIVLIAFHMRPFPVPENGAGRQRRAEKELARVVEDGNASGLLAEGKIYAAMKRLIDRTAGVWARVGAMRELEDIGSRPGRGR